MRSIIKKIDNGLVYRLSNSLTKILDNKFIRKYKSMSKPVQAAFAFTFVSILNNGLSFLTLPIFTRILTTEEIGLVTTYNSWFSILSIVVTLSLSSASFMIAMAEYKDERDDYEAFCVVITLISTIFFGSFLLLFKDRICDFLEIPKVLLFIMIFGFACKPAIDYWTLRNRYEYDYIKTVKVSCSLALISTAFSLISVYVFSKFGKCNLGTVKIISVALVNYSVGLFFVAYLIKNGKNIFRKKYFVFIIKVNMPLIIHALAKQILDVSDRIMISKLRGSSEVGIYGTLYSLSAVSLIVWSAINSSLVPYCFNLLSEKDSINKDTSKVTNILLIAYGIACIGLTLFAPEIVRIMAPKEYYDAIYIVPPIAAGIYCTALYNLFANILSYYKRTTLIMCATICATILNVVLNYIFIPIFGFVAASYTTLVAFVCLALFQYIAMKKVEKKSIYDNKFMWFFSIIIILVCIGINVLYQWIWCRYSIILIIFVLCIKYKEKVINAIKRTKGQ